MRIIYYFLIPILVLSSCTNEQEIQQDEPIVNNDFNGVRQMTEDEAKAVLYSFIDKLDQREFPLTRSSQVKINHVRKTLASEFSNDLGTNVRSLGAVEDVSQITPIYEFSLSDQMGNDGFALVIGDKRFSEVLAYTSQGSLSDTIFNKGLAQFMSAIPRYVNQLNNEYNQPFEDWLCNRLSGTERYLRNVYSEAELNSLEKNTKGAWDKVEHEESFVPVKWNQTAPYNNDIPLVCGDRKAKVGCAAVALGQIMAYHKKPKSYDWSLLLSSPTVKTIAEGESLARTKEVARLMANLGEMAGTTYTCSGSTTGDNGVLYAMRLLGYEGDKDVVRNSTVNHNIIYESLLKKLPVMMIMYDYYTKLGHIWVVDGILRKERDMLYFNTVVNAQTNKTYWEVWQCRERYTQLHCNWGWGGSSDGWYSHRCLDPVDDNYSFRGPFVELIYNIK